MFVARDDAVGTDADERDDSWTPAFDLRLESLTAGAKFVVGQFVSAGCRAFDDVCDTELQVQEQGFFKGRENARGEAATVQCWPEAVAGAAEMMAYGGSIEAGIDADEQDHEILRRDIRNGLVVRSEDLGFGRLPRCG